MDKGAEATRKVVLAHDRSERLFGLYGIWLLAYRGTRHCLFQCEAREFMAQEGRSQRLKQSTGTGGATL